MPPQFTTSRHRGTAALLAASLLVQGLLAVVHSHSVVFHVPEESAEHADGHCDHGPGQSHTDPHANSCSVCAVLIARQQQLAADAPLLLIDPQRTQTAPSALVAQVLILADSAPSLIPRGPPRA